VTDLGQPFHTDAGWLWMPPAAVGLFCLESAPDGGISRFVSLMTAHNEMARRFPDLLPRLYRPFAWDRQAEHALGDLPFARRPVYEHQADGALMARYYEDYVHNGQRLAGEPLDDEGREALLALRGIVDDPAHWVEFRVERGQLQYINNRQFAHSRTAFKDAPDGSRRRHMIRLWNRSEGTPDLEGQPSIRRPGGVMTRGEPAGDGASGLVFTGCHPLTATPAYAPAPAGGQPQTRRREVVVNGRRVRTVDVHAHCGVPEAMALMNLTPAPSLLMTQPADRIRAMDEQGIDVEALSINPTGTRPTVTSRAS
jgi:hypothetical protein